MKNILKITLLASAILALPAAAHANYGSSHTRQGASLESGASLSSNNVVEIQRSLARENFYNGPIDGVWGPRTTQAVRQYQQSNNMAVTGSLSSSDLSNNFGISLGADVDAEAGTMNTLSPAAGDTYKTND